MGAIAAEWGACMTAVSRQPKREYVDFSAVPPSQWAMHDRLTNWAKWSRGTARFDRAISAPMFVLYKSSDARREYGAPTSIPLDPKDATKVQVGVTALPEKHRRALHWYYLHPVNAMGMARELGLPLAGVAEIVIRARFMLINKGI